jgi:hypothetical protein
LAELLAQYPTLMRDPMQHAASEDGVPFVQRVVRTRNYMVHGSDRKGVAKSGIDLVRLAETLLFIIEVCLLAELGIDEQRQIEWFSRGNHRDWLFRPNIG